MSKAKNGEVLENFVLMLLYCICSIGRVCWFGLRRINFKELNTLSFFLLINGIPLLVLFGTRHYQEALNLSLPLMGALAVITLFACGFTPFRRHVVFQKAIERAGLKTATGEKPKVKAIVPMGECRLKVVVETYGVGLNKFQAQKDSLTAGFRQTVESIASNTDKGKVEIVLCERELPNMVSFCELYGHIKEPYSFIVGQSISNVVVHKIQSLPHLLISGATGGGKSVFFRSTMLSLLKSSPHIQLYLLDMKRGVEVKEFAALPNVRTAKNENEAKNILKLLVAEMHRRYRLLEQSGYKSIDTVRDKLDLIVVGIDEAAALFGKRSGVPARTQVDELARLARAAGIHLIVATQKPVKEAISTEILDNLSGRMTFRMISVAASTAALGRNAAQNLPAIEGRAVWSNGNERKQVQAPYVDDELIEAELEVINQEFKDGIRKNFSQLLGMEKKVNMSQVDKHAQS